MYALYSVLIVAFCAVMSPYLLYQARAIPEVHRNLPQRLGYLPRFVQSRRRRVDLDPCRVGGRSADRPRAAAGAARALSEAAPVPLDDHDDGAADCPQQPSIRRRSVLFSLRPGLHRQPDARAGEAAALHYDGDGDLAEPSARLPPRAASRRCWSTAGSRRARIRATGWRARSSAASCATSIASACRATNRRGASSTSAPSRERVIVTGSLKFDSLEHPRRLVRPGIAAETACCAISASPPDRPVIIAASTLQR